MSATIASKRGRQHCILLKTTSSEYAPLSKREKASLNSVVAARRDYHQHGDKRLYKQCVRTGDLLCRSHKATSERCSEARLMQFDEARRPACALRRCVRMTTYPQTVEMISVGDKGVQRQQARTN